MIQYPHKVIKKHIRFYILLAVLLALLMARYGLQIGVPRVALTAMIALIALLGDRDEVLAIAMCCIPLHEAVDFFYALVACAGIYVLKNYRRFRINLAVCLVLLIIMWELLHCFDPSFSFVTFLITVMVIGYVPTAAFANETEQESATPETTAVLMLIDGAYYYARTSGEIVVNRTYYISKNNDLQECYAFPSMPVILPFQDGALFEGESKADLYKKLIETRSMNSICLKAVRKECAVIPEYIPTSCRLMHGEDLIMSACFITSASKIRYINNGIYHYRKTLGSITYSYKSTLNTSLKTVHTLLDKFIEVWDIPDMAQTHDARKVSGWMDVLVFMLKSKSQISFQEKINIMKSMATDPYFVLAYQNMDRLYLKKYYRFLSFLMYKKFYCTIIIMNTLKTAGSQIKKKLRRSKHGG